MRTLIILAVIIAALSVFLQDYIEVTGVFRHISSIGKEKCSVVKEPIYCEDMVLLRSKSLAFLSCDPNRRRWNTVMGSFDYTVEEQGYIWIYKYETRAAPQKLSLNGFSGDFHPLGFHLFELNSTTVLLTVTNHKRSGNVIEQFFYHFKEPMMLSHIRTISHPLIHTPNAIEMLSPTKFYFTNDHRYYNGTMKVVENWTRIPGGSIVFIDLEDPTQIKVVAEGLRFANGVATRDQRYFFVAECLGGLVKVYERQTDNTLAFIRSVKVGYAVDNVRVDEESGDVYVAGHPNVIKFMLYSKRNIGTSPSRVVRLRFGKDNAAEEILNLEKDAELTVIFEDDGSFYPTSSTAAVDNNENTVLITGLYADGILHCSK